MKQKIAIIGGGWTGLTAAYRLSKAGYKVTVLEKGGTLGGLAGGFVINGTNLEKAYHHIFKTDKDIIGLVKDLGLEDKLEWREGGTAVFYRDGIYPFTTPIDLLKFPHLGLADKIRMGLVALYLQKDNHWQKYVKVKAKDWMKKWCGQNAYRVIWEPLLRGKFHDYYDKVSMAWLWARIHTRGNSKEKGETSEKLGYFNGGFNIVTEALIKAIKSNGGVIRTGVSVSLIESNKGKVEITTDGKIEIFDRVIACIPSAAFAGLIGQQANREYVDKLKRVDYLGAVLVIFTSRQSLSSYYWHNINDLQSPFLAFIQHTNFVPSQRYGGEEVYYMGTYVPHDHRYFTDKEEILAKEFFDYLKKIFPDFDKKAITSKYVFKLKHAQHIVDVNYEEKIPDYLTPLPGVYLANFSQIFPEDRGTNFAVREGNKIAKMVI